MRVYDESAIEQIALVDLLTLAGFTLGEIAELIDLRGRVASDWREKAEAKIGELDARIKELRVARTLLKHTLQCQHPSLDTCPVFRQGVADHAASPNARVAESEATIAPLAGTLGLAVGQGQRLVRRAIAIAADERPEP